MYTFASGFASCGAMFGIFDSNIEAVVICITIAVLNGLLAIKEK